MTASDTVASSPAVDRGAIVPLYGYQRELIESNARFHWSCWSRQSGKSFAHSLRRILRGYQRGRNQLFLSASELQSAELMMKAKEHLQVHRIAASDIVASPFEDTKLTKLEITVPGVMRIIGLPANPRTSRGFTGDVLLDEFSMHAQDEEIYAGIFFSITACKGELDVCGTPRGKKNKFYRLKLTPRFEHQTVTIHDAVAGGLDVDVEDLRAGLNDDEKWRQEALCEFLDEATAFLTYELIGSCEDVEISAGPPDWSALVMTPGELYAGMDIGRRHDLTVIWLLRREGERLVTCGVIELDKTPFREQQKVLSRVMELRGLRRCCIDESGLGMEMAENAVRDFGAHRVEKVTFTQAAKQEMAGGLRIRFEERSIAIPASETIREDLHSITKLVTAAGNVRYLAERTKDGHADRFWAAALAVQAASTPTGPAEAFSAKPFRFAKQKGAL